MPSFKPKATKKIKVCKRYSTTLDGKHKEIMSDFSKKALFLQEDRPCSVCYDKPSFSQFISNEVFQEMS